MTIDSSDVIFQQAGTGATPRSVQDRLRDWVSIRDFSADASGITAALAAHPGALVPPGTYNTATLRTVDAGKVLELMPGAVLTGPWAVGPGGGVISKTDGFERNTWLWTRNITGPVHAGPGPFSGYSPAAFHFEVRTDTATLPDIATDQFLRGFLYNHVVASGYTGSREGTRLMMEINAPSSDGGSYFYPALQTAVFGNANLNGTDTGNGAKGHLYGAGLACYASAAATNLLDFTGVEINTFAAAGSSMKYSSGASIAGANKARGAVVDCAVRITGTEGHVGWNDGILFTDANNANPLHAASKLLSSYWTGGGTKSIGYGIDLRGFSIANAAFVSNGFSVDGTGLVTLASGRPVTWKNSGGIFITGSAGAQIFSFPDGTYYIDNYDGGGFTWRTSNYVPLATLTSAGLNVPAGITARPGVSQTPQANGDVTFQLTNDMSLTFKARGADGVVRQGSIPLA